MTMMPTTAMMLGSLALVKSSKQFPKSRSFGQHANLDKFSRFRDIVYHIEGLPALVAYGDHGTLMASHLQGWATFRRGAAATGPLLLRRPLQSGQLMAVSCLEPAVEILGCNKLQVISHKILIL